MHSKESTKENLPKKMENGKSKGEIDWEKMGWQVAIASASHSVTQARNLIQLGHEPVPAFHKEAGFLRFISPGGKFHNGILTGYLSDARLLSLEVYRVGLAFKLIETVTSSVAQTAAEPIIDDYFLNKGEPTTYDEVLTKSLREFMLKATGVTISRPFYVLAIRQIASIADGKCDSNVMDGLKSLFADGGFFAGLAPRLLHEALVIFGLNSLVYLYEQNLKDKSPELTQKTFPMVLTLAVNSICYPLHLVSNIQCIQGTNTSLDVYPELSWLGVLSQLYAGKEHSRGSSVLFSRKSRKVTSIESAV